MLPRMCRGVGSWRDPHRRDGEECRVRVFMATINASLVAVDAKNGELCRDFGDEGVRNFKKWFLIVG